jgi:hypothetical protein
MKGIFTLFLLLLYLHPFYSLAQQINPFVINVTGGSASSGNYRFDWSVGEMCLVNSFMQPGGTLENGFLHPGTERKVDTINFFAKGDIMVYPNPVYSTAEINLLLPLAGTFHIMLFDVLGRPVMTKTIVYNGSGSIEKIYMEQFRAGTYFMQVKLTPTDPGLPERKGIYKITHLTR